MLPQLSNGDDRQVIALAKALKLFQTGQFPGLCVTVVLSPGDARENNVIFREAEANVIAGLMKQETFRIVLKRRISENAKLLRGRFLSVIRNYGTDDEVLKPCFVVQAHTDEEKNLLM